MIGDELVAHTGVIQMPMRKGWKRIHRFVVLPDYQGIGVGTVFINAIAEIVKGQGYDVNLTTTTPSLTHALRRSPAWILKRFGRCKSTLGDNMSKYYGKEKHIQESASSARITYSFNYKGVKL